MDKYNVALDMPHNSVASLLMNNIPEGSKVLEFGCAHGRMTKYMHEQKKCSVYIIEIDKAPFNDALKYAEDGICCDAEGLEWTEKYKGIEFDRILFADVLEHLKQPGIVLTEAVKLLRDDGMVLASIPNIAHADIICNLLQNRFKYTETGLLDDSHLHFWGAADLDDFAESAGLAIVEKNGYHVDMFHSEQGHSARGVTEYIKKSLELRPLNSVYQFVLAMQKKDWVEKHGIQCINKMESTREETSFAYFDTGLGYNDEERIVVYPRQICGVQEREYLITDIPVDCTAVRFDPCERAGIIMYIHSIVADGMQLSGYVENGFSIDNCFVFLKDDPYYVIPLSERHKKITIRASVYDITPEVALSLLQQISREYENNIRAIRDDASDLKEAKQRIISLERSTDEYISFIRELEESKDAQINALTERIEEKEKNEKQLTERIEEKEKNEKQQTERIAKLSVEVDSKSATISDLNRELDEVNNEKLNFYYNLRETLKNYSVLEEHYKAVMSSTSWNITAPMRAIVGWIRRIGKTKTVDNTSRKIENDANISANTEESLSFVSTVNEEKAYNLIKNADTIDIITTKHTGYIAQQIHSILIGYGIKSNVLYNEPEKYDDIPYIIICPQFIKKFPEVYIAYQMEQTINERWLTKEYLQTLANAYAIFDYSLVNIEYFSKYPELAKKNVLPSGRC